MERFFQYSFAKKNRSKHFIQKRNILNSEAHMLIQKQTLVLPHSHLHLHNFKCANTWIMRKLEALELPGWGSIMTHLISLAALQLLWNVFLAWFETNLTIKIYQMRQSKFCKCSNQKRTTLKSPSCCTTVNTPCDLLYIYSY